MADVSRGDGGRRRDRGQLFLVGALSLAVLFVVLALLMNTAIYTENVATRGTDSGTDGAIRYGQAARAGTAGLVGYVNAHDNSSHDALAANLTAGVGAMSDAASVHHAYEGVSADASLVATTNGSWIGHDDETRAFVTSDGADPTPENWTLAPSIERTRAFRMNVTRSSLASDTASAFRVTVSDGTEWRAYVYGSGDAVTVKVRNGTDSISSGSCAGPTGAAGEHVSVDLTRGTVGGEPCPLLDFARNVPAPYSIGFENGDRAAGTYGLVVDDPNLVTDPNGVFADDASNSPHVVPAIYSAKVAVTYEGPRITYRTNVTVVPEDGR